TPTPRSSPAVRRACSAPIGSNTMSGASPDIFANICARVVTATCMERAQNTFNMAALIFIKVSGGPALRIRHGPIVRSLLDVLHHSLGPDLGAVDVALGVG